MATFGGRFVESKKWNKCGIQLNTVGQVRKVGFQLHKTGLMRTSSISIRHYGAKVEELFHFHTTFWGKSGGAPHSTHILDPTILPNSGGGVKCWLGYLQSNRIIYRGV